MILDAYQSAEIMTGIFPSLAPVDAPLWADGQDCLFRSGGVQNVSDSSRFLTFLSTSQETTAISQSSVEQLQDGQAIRQNRIFYNKGAEVWVSYRSGSDASIEVRLDNPVFNAKAFYDHEFVIYGNYLFHTNGVDEAKIWQGDLTYTTDASGVNVADNGLEVALTPAVTTKRLTKLNQHLIAGNILYSQDQRLGNEIRWSDSTNPLDWTPTTTNTAGGLVLRDLESDIKAFCPLANGLAVYGSDSMGVLSFIGGNLVFGFQKLFNNIGVVGSKAVVEVGYENFGLSRQGVFRTDGSTVTYVDEPAMRQYLQQNVDWFKAERTLAFHDEEARMVVFYYPQIGLTENLLRGVGYNYENKTWTRFRKAFSAASPRKVFPYAVVADSRGLLWHGVDGGSENFTVTTKPLLLKRPERYKVIRALRLGFEGRLQVRLGYSDTREKYIFKDEPYHDCEAEMFLEERECVYLTLEFSTFEKETFLLNSILVEGLVQGMLL